MYDENIDFQLLASNIERLAQQAGVSRNKALIESGVGKDFITNMINKHQVPSLFKAVQLAKYFNVSIDYLLGIDTKHNKDVPTIELSIDKKRLLEMYSMLSDMEKGEILGELKTLTQRKLVTVATAARNGGNPTTETITQEQLEALRKAKSRNY